MIDILTNQLTRFGNPLPCPTGTFFGLPGWQQYVCGAGHGDFKIPADIPLVLLALFEILLRIAGIAAIAYVIFGSIKYVVSRGESDKIAEAKGTIINALAGMVISVFAVAMVSFLGNRLGGTTTNIKTGNLDTTKLPGATANEVALQSALNIVFVITGAISVMMVVIGGIQYASSQGDPSQVSKAKNTILYALVGLAISIFAVTIVSFVAGRVS